MKSVYLAYTLQLSPLILAATLFGKANPALSQASNIVPDDTLGAESSVVNSQDENRDNIDGGALRGSNLFHSFQEFNVGEGKAAYFANPDAVNNIFSRVTGNNVSNILGTLGVDGAANLYLINPNGIVFGEGASLDVQGSFTATTADGIEFGENGFFSAITPQESVLTINVPLGLQFGSSPGSIINRSYVSDNTNELVGLQVPTGENLTLVGGDISFEGGEATVSEGNIEIGGLSESGTVTFNDDGSLSFPEDVAKADVTLTNEADIDARSTGGGNISINARNISLDAGKFNPSQIRAGITADSTSSQAQAGDITLNATDTITVSEGSSITNFVEESGIGNSGEINITTSQLSLTQGSRVSTSTLGEGNGGTVNINADDSIFVSGQGTDGFASSISSVVAATGVGNSGEINITTSQLSLDRGGRVIASILGEGNGGKIDITTGSLILSNGASIDTSTSGEGNAGNVLIEAEEVSFSDSTIYTEVSDAGGIGNAGNININTNSLSLQNGSSFLADTENQGDAGNISIEARDSVVLKGRGEFPNQITSTVDASANSDVEGDAGNIVINTDSLSIADGGFISTDTSGKGDGGKITVNANESVFLNSSNIYSDINSNAVGNSEGIEITTGSLVLTNSASLDTRTSGEGNAGNVLIKAQKISFSDSTIYTEVSSDGGEGNAGDINISTNSLLLQNSFFLVDTENIGNAGNILIEADDSVVLEGSGDSPSQITSTVEAIIDPDVTRKAGNIEINTGSLSITDEGFIRTSTFSNGNGGKITINARESVTLGNEKGSGRLESDVELGAMGNSGGIEINTGSLTVNKSSQITSQVIGKGNSGNVDINAKETVSFSGRDETDKFPSAIFTSVEPSGKGNGGDINIQAESLKITDRAQLLSNVEGMGNAGDINIQVDNEVTLVNSDIISEITEPDKNSKGGSGEGGNISIKTDSLLLQDGSSFLADTENIGNAGDITIEASEKVVLEGEGPSASNPKLIVPSQITSTVDVGGKGEGGNINISTPFLSVAEGGYIRTSTFSKGDAGNIDIQADNILVDGFDSDGFGSFIASEVNTRDEVKAKGNGGNIEIIADNLSITNAGEISASTFGEGNAGNLSIIADNIKIDGGLDGFLTGLFAQVEENAAGEGGNLTIGSEQFLLNQLNIINGGQTSVSTSGKGNAGNLTIFADNIKIDGGENGLMTGLLAQVRENASGQGGSIDIGNEQSPVKQISIINGAGVSVSTFGQGNAGNLFIFADNFVVNGGENNFETGLFASVRKDATGQGGNINLGNEQFSIEQLNVTNRARILVSTFGLGKAGDIKINANFLNLDNDGLIDSRSESDFDAGNITLDISNYLQAIDSSISTSSDESSGGNLTITAGDIELRGDSDFTTNISSGEGSGGNITIEADSIIAFDDSDIFASAPEGQGGNITLDTPAFFAENFTLNSLTEENIKLLRNNDRADVNATGAVSSGSVEIPDVSSIQNSLTELPNNSLDTDELVANSCVVPVGNRSQGKFVITGGESLPVRPGDNLPSKFSTGEVRSVPEDNNSSWQHGDPIIEPQGAYRLANGKIVLSRECSQ